MHINELLRLATANGASDLYLKADIVPILRINGEPFPQTGVAAITQDIMQELFTQNTNEKLLTIFARELELDFAYFFVNR